MLTLTANTVLALEDLLLNLEDTIERMCPERDELDIYLLDMAVIQCHQAISTLSDLIMVDEALREQ